MTTAATSVKTMLGDRRIVVEVSISYVLQEFEQPAMAGCTIIGIDPLCVVAFQISVNPATGTREYGPVMQEAPTQISETLGRMFGNASLGAFGPLGLGFNIGDVRGYIDRVTGERYQYSEVGGIIPGLFGGGQPQLRSYAGMQAERDAEMARDNGGDGGGTPSGPGGGEPVPAPQFSDADAVACSLEDPESCEACG